MATNSSIISVESLIDNMLKSGIISKDQVPEDHDHEELLMSKKQNKYETRLMSRMKLREMTIRAPIEKEEHDHHDEDEAQRKVQVVALDMDWLFLDNNYNTLLTVLAEGSNEPILTAK